MPHSERPLLSTILRWLPLKWRIQRDDITLQAFPLTFNTPHGQIVLQYLLDNIYCTIHEGSDTHALAFHEGQRSVVQLILEHIDKSTNPVKWEIIQGVHSNGATS